MSSTPYTQYQAPRYGQNGAGVLALLIRSASFQAGRQSRKPIADLDSWLQEQAATMESTRLTMAGTGATEQSPQSVGVSDSKLHATFRQIAGMLYKLRRMGLPAHPDYQIFAADPQAQIKLDADARELFGYLQDLKLEILNRVAPSSDAAEQSVAEEAWNGLRRDLGFEDEAAVEDTQTPPEGGTGNLADADLSFAGSSSSAHETLTSVLGSVPDEPPSPLSYWIDLHPIEGAKTDPHEGESRIIPDEPPSPLSYWIDLHPIDDAEVDLHGNENRFIPDEPPSPLSYWIDLHPIDDAKANPHEDKNRFIPETPPVPISHWINLRPIEDYRGLVREVAPEPTSMFLELHPLDDLSPPEVPPSPVELTLALYESHD
ncbi:hypothetical protein FIBSPDRAFT_247175 [Athelia psychrophila]|uniref:Uncharacterized protein n=1 Tax=Athelia psychrophila TaxID=1759441 RepID=A0A166RVW8_9AGAM|nr:hypothetical protein FIBSPDRAFT_247175 [Fibularhizoctonia sp. CBS 109695]